MLGCERLGPTRTRQPALRPLLVTTGKTAFASDARDLSGPITSSAATSPSRAADTHAQRDGYRHTLAPLVTFQVRARAILIARRANLADLVSDGQGWPQRPRCEFESA